MTSPDFIIPGPSKSGTTSLHHYLKEHPDIYMAESKVDRELHFFNNDEEYSKGLDYYEDYFSTATEEVVGEKTPAYFRKGTVWGDDSKEGYRWDPENDVPSRIHECYPDVKLIFSMRNPATRAYSQYWKNYRQGRETATSFKEALMEELQGERSPEETQYCWIFQNSYSLHIERWLEFFDRDQMKFLVFEEWVSDPEEALNDICRFLDVEPLSEWSRSDIVKNVGGTPRFVSLNRFYQKYIDGTVLSSFLRGTGVTHFFDRLNSKKGYPEMTREEWGIAKEVFTDDIEELESLINRDLGLWKEEIRDNAN